MFPDARSARLTRILCIISLACPAILVAVVLLLKAGIIRFHDDFYGFKGVGFFLAWGIVMLPTGTLTGIAAIFLDRAAWAPRIAAGLNAFLLTGFILLLARFFL